MKPEICPSFSPADPGLTGSSPVCHETGLTVKLTNDGKPITLQNCPFRQFDIPNNNCEVDIAKVNALKNTNSNTQAAPVNSERNKQIYSGRLIK
jgi:hypothetical protein